MQAIDRRFVIRTVDIASERLGAVKQAHPQTLAAAVRFQDRRAAGEMLFQRRNEPILAGNQHGVRMPAALSAAYCRALLISRSSARGPLTIRRPWPASQASTDAVNSAA